MHEELLFVLHRYAIDPYIHILRQVDRGEVLNPLVDHKPRVIQELSRLIDDPNPHRPIRAAGDQLVHLLNVNHIEDAAFMPNNCLKAWICFDASKVSGGEDIE